MFYDLRMEEDRSHFCKYKLNCKKQHKERT